MLMAAPSAGWCSGERALGRANQTSTAPCSWRHHPQDGAPVSEPSGEGTGPEPREDAVPVVVPGGGVDLQADLAVPDDAYGVVVFAHGSGSGRSSPRNREVAAALRRAGLATLLLDLLTLDEEQLDRSSAALRFDIGL